MRVTIIGSVNFDRIVTLDGAEKNSLGGILYNVFSLASLSGSDLKIFPLIKVGKQHWTEVIKLLGKYRNVDSLCAKVSPTGTNENLLVYVAEGERSEKLKLRIVPFTFEEVEPYLCSDLILLNFVSGSEIQLGLLEKIRQNSNSLIYMDVHSKVLGMKEDGTRYPLGWADWEKWLKYTDIVQMNLDECRLLLRERIESTQSLLAAARRIAEVGPAQVLITLGRDGVLVYWRNGEERWELIPASTHEVLDTTGCGDCFTAGYIWGLFKYGQPIKAACIGNIVAGENCVAVGLIEGPDPNRIEETAVRFYRDYWGRVLT